MREMFSHPFSSATENPSEKLTGIFRDVRLGRVCPKIRRAKFTSIEVRLYSHSVNLELGVWYWLDLNAALSKGNSSLSWHMVGNKVSFNQREESKWGNSHVKVREFKGHSFLLSFVMYDTGMLTSSSDKWHWHLQQRDILQQNRSLRIQQQGTTSRFQELARKER